jgi:membrane protein EpsK
MGLEGLGLIRISLSIPMYIGLITIAFMGSFTRYLSIAMTNGDHDEAREIFSTAFFAIVLFFSIVIPGFTVLCVLFVNYFSLGIVSNNFIYQMILMLIYAFISTLSVIFVLPSYVKNRQELYNLNKFIALFIQTSAIFLLFSYAVKIYYIGYAFVFGALIAMAYSLLIYKYSTSHLNVSTKLFRLSRAKEIFNLSKWTSLDSIGMLLLFTVDLVLVGYFLGGREAGKYSILIQILLAMFAISKTIGGIFGPRIYSFYAKNDFVSISNISIYSVVITGASLAFITAIIVGFRESILYIWLGVEYVELSPLILYGLILFPLIMSTSAIPNVFTAFLKIKTPALWTLGIGFLHSMTVVILILSFDFNILGVIASLSVYMFIRNVVLQLFYLSKLITINQLHLAIALLFTLFVFIVTYVLSRYMTANIEINLLIELIFSAFVVGVLFVAFSFYPFVKIKKLLMAN